MKSGYIVCVAIVIFFTGCAEKEKINTPDHLKELENLTVYSPDTEPVAKIQFVQEVSFGDTEDIIIGRLGSTAVDDHGRVYIADASQQVIHIFLPDGNYLAKIGREGSGPGEFRRISKMQILSDQLFVHDENQRRIVVFSILNSVENHTEVPTYSRTVNLETENWRHIEALGGAHPNQFYAWDETTILIGFERMLSMNERYVSYYLLDENGRIVSDKLLELRDANFYSQNLNETPHVFLVPFTRKPLFAIGNGQIHSAYSDEFFIKSYGPSGEHLNAFYYQKEILNMERDKVMSQLSEFNQRLLQNVEFPDAWPVLENMIVDEKNRFWIATVTDQEEYHSWWVLDEEGMLLAQFSWPGYRMGRYYQNRSPKDIQEIRNGSLYVRETDDTGLTRIVRYRIEMEYID